MRGKAVEEKGSFELIEEAFHLLRLAPGPALAGYYLGSLPFLLGLLFFWSDMASSALAEQRLVPGALGLTFLFVWMKAWQSVFARHLLAHLCGEPQPRWTLSWLGRTALFQAIVQAPGLFLLPLSLFLMVPFGWVYAFCSSATVFSGCAPPDARALFRRSWRQAALWPKQNHNVLLLLTLFGLFVFLNLYSAVFAVPFLLDRFLGIETVFTRSPWAALNSTVTAAVAGLSYLCLDPVLKAVYVLRCFYGESLRTGQDLKAELRSCPTANRAAALGLLLLLPGFHVLGAFGAQEPGQTRYSKAESRPLISPSELDRSIEQILRQREYTWRSPRETAPAKPADAKPSWLERSIKTMEETLKTVSGWIADWINWLRNLGPRANLPSASGRAIASAMSGLAFLLIVGLVGLLAWLLFRLCRGRPPGDEIEAQVLAPAPDVADEAVGPGEMPEDGWIRMARELVGRGEPRLALRAFYLATLAHLAERNLIALARFKSNHDYEGELQRRGHALAAMLHLFSQNLSVFERVWYGLHEVTPEMLEEFAGNVERMQSA